MQIIQLLPLMRQADLFYLHLSVSYFSSLHHAVLTIRTRLKNKYAKVPFTPQQLIAKVKKVKILYSRHDTAT